MSRTRDADRVLEVTDIVVTFGGLVALGGVSLDAHPGRITGLIGPNGAGKTTLFNVCSGLQAQDSGIVRYAGEEISHRSPSWRARHGIGRTFQQMELFESMTVEQNVRLGREARLAGTRPTQAIWARSGQRQDIHTKAEEALAICGLDRIRKVTVANLSTGDRRLAELARCIAGDFDLLLLDEPSSGLDPGESRQFGEVLRRLVAEQGTGVLLIEHDIELVMQVCAYIHVLDFGKKIFEGTPAEVRSSREVQAAYLGVVEDRVGVTETRTTPEVVVNGGGLADQPALELVGVTAAYGEFTALWDVTIDVPRSSVVALVGPNGAGKTTSLRVASGLLPPKAGQVRVGGVDVTRASPGARARAGLCLIPEGRGIYRSLTVRENLQLHVPAWRPDQTIDPAVEAFPTLGKRLGQRAGSLSGGEQQMLAVSRAYLADPKIVLLDELSMGLAPLVIAEIFASIERLISTGVSVLIVEQFVARALKMADYAVVLAKGVVMFQGPAAGMTEERLTSMYLGVEA